MSTKEKNERPRLVNRHVVQGEVAQQALAVADASCEGVVDGVLIDFRHPGLPPAEWEARPWWFVGDTDAPFCGFLLPSEAAALDEGRWGVLGEDEDLIQRKKSLPRAAPGDRLTVESVVDRISDRRFDHRHDATVKMAYLALTRASGEVVRPSSPMAFYGATQLRDAPERDAYDRLASRILAEHGNPNPHAFEIRHRLGWPFAPAEGYGLSERAALAIERVELAWLKLHTTHLRDDPMGRAALRSALNNAVLAAFFQAKHESKPAEDRQQRVEEGADRGRGKPKANDGRFDYARSIWRDDPSLSLTALAREVVEQVYLNGEGELVSESAMRDSLNRAIERGELTVPPESPSHPSRAAG